MLEVHKDSKRVSQDAEIRTLLSQLGANTVHVVPLVYNSAEN